MFEESPMGELKRVIVNVIEKEEGGRDILKG